MTNMKGWLKILNMAKLSWKYQCCGSGSGMGKIRIWDPRSGINISDHISESLVTVFFLLKVLNSLSIQCYGSRMEKSRSGNGKSRILEKLSAFAELSGEGDCHLRLQCGQGGRAHLPGAIYLPVWQIRFRPFFCIRIQAFFFNPDPDLGFSD